MNVDNQSKTKSKIAAAVLQIFFGTYGIGRFYMDSKKIAFIQIFSHIIGIIIMLSFIPYGLIIENMTDITKEIGIDYLYRSVWLFLCGGIISIVSTIWGVVDGLYLLLRKNVYDGKGRIMK